MNGGRKAFSNVPQIARPTHSMYISLRASRGKGSRIDFAIGKQTQKKHTIRDELGKTRYQRGY